MSSLEKLGKETAYVEMKATQLQSLENISMYESGIFEMANYQPEDSGLPYGLWFDELGKSRKNTHNKPRTKIIMPSDNLIPVSIEKEPEILLKGTRLSKAERELKGKKKDEMFNFISDNCELILQHWNGDITTMTLFNNLKRR